MFTIRHYTDSMSDIASLVLNINQNYKSKSNYIQKFLGNP